MNQSNSKIGEIAEAIFCIIYLIFIFVASAVFFLSAGNNEVLKLFGWLALVLGSGDSFHLIPRVFKTFFGNSKRTQWWTGLGLMVSSITMTIFYLILFHIWKVLFYNLNYPAILSWLIYISAILRILLCFFPQNNWFNPKGNLRWSLYRNLPFAVTGICLIILFIISDNYLNLGLWQMSIAIFISFACYFPVVIYAKRIPAVGMLMIPKTIAYMWLIILGLSLIPKLY